MTEKRGNIPEGICPECGIHYYGWALTQPEHQNCQKCGARLELVSKHPTTDNFSTMAQVIGHRFCINPRVVERWLEKKEYGVEDFNTIINEINGDFEHWLAEVLECSEGVRQDRGQNV